MKRTIATTAAIAAAIVLASVTARAETLPQPSWTPAADAPAIGEGTIGARGRSTRAKVKKGWNTIHASTCIADNRDDGPHIALYSSDDDALDVGISASAGFPTMQTAMSAQCARGNLTAFYVSKFTATSFIWTALGTYGYQ